MRQVFTLFFTLFTLFCRAQTGTVAYTRDFEFREGFYLTIDDFKNNRPLPKTAIVSSISPSEIDFLSQLTEMKFITFKDSAGVEKKLQTSTVWGYYQNRTVCINFNGEFHRMNVIGNLCLFSALVVQAPLRNEPIGDMYAIEPRFEELQHFVLDTKTNRVVDFNSKNMEVLLKDDADLYASFMKLKKRKKADSIFIYLRKYNEKHPLYLASK